MGGGGLHKVIKQVFGCGGKGAETASRWRCGLLLQDMALNLGGALPTRTERRQIPAGDGTAAVACRGVLHCPRRCIEHR